MTVADPVQELALLERPEPKLRTYYTLASFLWGPLFPIALIMYYGRYRSLHYSFDEQGITVDWGTFNHHEISVDYARIQDLHLRSNVVERWLGLARIEIQTASSNKGAELVIEGFSNYLRIRDHLYAMMAQNKSADTSARHTAQSGAYDAELAQTLAAIAEEVKAIRQQLTQTSEVEQ